MGIFDFFKKKKEEVQGMVKLHITTVQQCDAKTTDILAPFFNKYLRCGIPSLMPCLRCGKLMVRPKSRHTEEYRHRHRAMVYVKGMAKNNSHLGKYYSTVLCEDCGRSCAETDVVLPEECLVEIFDM